MSAEVNKIIELTERQNKWRGDECLNLIASENVLSPLARKVYNSDFMHRYAEGLPFKRYYQGVRYIDEIETLCIELMKKVYKVKNVDVRPISGANANLCVLAALGKPGDTLITPGVPAGTHISQEWFGCAGIRGLNVVHCVYDFENLCIDVEKTKRKIVEVKPKILGFGASLFTFPHPIKEFVEVAKEVNAKIWYDGAHVAGLIGAGLFQDPLREGADVVTISTHKTLPGPQGGAILSNCDEKEWKKIQAKVFPGAVSNHHLHRLPALAITLLEFLKFGKKYCEQTVKNAKKMAKILHNNGFNVLWKKEGFTQTHQFAVDVVEEGGGKEVAERLEKANIILNKNLLPYDNVDNAHNPSGIRIGVQELTRFGMKEKEMEIIADFITRIIKNREEPENVKEEVIAFRKKFTEVKYCF